VIVFAMFLSSSCISKRKLLDAQRQYETLQNDSALVTSKMADLQAAINTMQSNISSLNQ